jgi:rSAM/selenodomain-associated transferase 1
MEGRTARNLLVIMVKEPVPGTVNTRLTPPLPPVEAAALAQCFLEDRLAEMSRIQGADLAIAYAPSTAGAVFALHTRRRFRLFPQHSGDLGARMQAIFTEQIAAGYHHVCIIGTDSPDLPHSIVLESFRLLAATATDVVLGPAIDGGYYLIGMRRPLPLLFTDIPWGTADVLPITLARVQNAGLRIATLPEWHDLDTIEDLHAFYTRYGTSSAKNSRAGAKTFACLETLDIFRDQPHR